MKFAFALVGIAFGTVEFLLTKRVCERATASKPFLVPLVVKLLLYGAAVALVFLLPNRAYILPFGIGAGSAVLATALMLTAIQFAKEKR